MSEDNGTTTELSKFIPLQWTYTCFTIQCNCI